MSKQNVDFVDTLVIGGGQAGLSVGYYLAERGIPFQILDASPRIGDAWRNRWDSLRLFTPARYVTLPGMPMQARGDYFPSKDDMADYLKSYAANFRLPVASGIRVDKLWKEGGRFVAAAGSRRFEANNVVVAMANYQSPRVPKFAAEIDPSVVQLHAHEYRNPGQLQDGNVLVVGVGNSGADIAIDVAKSHPTFLAGKESGHIPFRIETFLARFVLVRLIRFIGHHVLSVATPIGRKKRPEMLHRAAPLVRVKPQDLIDSGIERVERVAGAREGKPLLEGGRTLDVRNVIWCTGYEPGFSWIDLPVFGGDGHPLHERGIAQSIPGLYFVGLHFLYSMTSATVTGISRDAKRIVDAIAVRAPVAEAAPQKQFAETLRASA
jgi:putative flavoprotein involved in K+ transport